MEEIVYELNGKGDIYLALDNVPEGNEITEQNGDEITAGATDSTHAQKQHLLRILVSSKHLTLSCPQFERRFQEGFQEGNELRSTGKKPTISVQDWSALPFLILMMIIHHRTRSVPRKLSLERLAEIAQLVDYYECYEAVEVFSDMWIDGLAMTRRVTSVQNAEKWLFISWV